MRSHIRLRTLSCPQRLAVALAELEQAKAQETDARNNLSYTEIKSPSNGVVGTLPFRIGALVSPGMTQPSR